MLIIITIPAYNEEETLPSVIKEINLVMKKTKYVYKVMVLDDGSDDDTVKVAKKAGAIVYSNSRNRGLAETFKHEVRRCLDLNADIIVHTDADGQYPAEYIPVMLKEIAKGNDLILGSRFAGEIEDMPVLKKWGNIAFAKVFSQLTGAKITDSTTGFRAFTKDVAKEIELNTDFTYTHEQLLKASRLKFRIKEIPIYARKTRESKLMKGPIDYAIKAWINLFRIQRDYNPLGFFGKIGIIFLTMGVLLGLWIVQTFLLTGQTGGIPRTILSVLLLLTGVQIIFFGFLAEMQRK